MLKNASSHLSPRKASGIPSHALLQPMVVLANMSRSNVNSSLPEDVFLPAQAVRVAPDPRLTFKSREANHYRRYWSLHTPLSECQEIEPC